VAAIVHMTQQQFIALLCVYGIVVILAFVTEKFTPLPVHVSSAKPNRAEILKRKPKAYLGLFALTAALVIGCTIIGFVGMFFFWHVAPWIFACGVAGQILLFPAVFWSVQSGLVHRLNELELLLDGVILILVFFGPARQLFF
jgi:hypothetical protein